MAITSETSGPIEQREGALPTCPIEPVMELLGRRHTLAVLQALSLERPLRFGELEATVGITPKTLTRRLEELTEAGILDRQAYPEIPPRVEYDLTEKGQALLPIFEVLDDWAETYGTDGATPA